MTTDARRAPEDSERAEAMLRAVEGIDFDSADGRAGLTAWLLEIERQSPGALQRLRADVSMIRAGRLHPGSPTAQ